MILGKIVVAQFLHFVLKFKVHKQPTLAPALSQPLAWPRRLLSTTKIDRMKNQSTPRSLFIAALIALAIAVPAHAATVSYDLNADPAANGFTLGENAVWNASGGVGGSGYVSLTEAAAD